MQIGSTFIWAMFRASQVIVGIVLLSLVIANAVLHPISNLTLFLALGLVTFVGICIQYRHFAFASGTETALTFRRWRKTYEVPWPEVAEMSYSFPYPELVLKLRQPVGTSRLIHLSPPERGSDIGVTEAWRRLRRKSEPSVVTWVREKVAAARPQRKLATAD